MTQTISSRLFIVDPHGNVLHRLTWESGQYVVAEDVLKAVLTNDTARTLQLAEPGAGGSSQALAPAPPEPDAEAMEPQPAKREVYTADAILAELKRAYEPLQDAVIVGADGTVLAATSDTATMMGEVVTALLEFGLQACETLDMGEMLEISSRDTQMLALTYPAADGVALGVTTPSTGNLALLYRSCQRTLQLLAEWS